MSFQQQNRGYGTSSYDSQNALNQDYQAVANPSTPNKEAYYPPANSNPAKAAPSSKKKWWILGGIIILLAIIGGVVGGVVGSRSSSPSNAAAKSGSSNSGSGTGQGTSGGTNPSGGTGGAGATNDPTAKNFVLPQLDARGNPIYTGTGTPAAPSVGTASNLNCGADPWTPPSGQNTGTGTNLQVRPGHPRLVAPGFQWECMQQLTANDGYLRAWNETIMSNATFYFNQPVTVYVTDGGMSGSGVLDIARETQLRVKHWAYAYRMTKDTAWVNRTWTELFAMSGNLTGSPAATVGTAGDTWNSLHFLDVAEFTFAFALAYDWMFDAWTEAQRTAIMWSIITLGLDKGITGYAQNSFWLIAKGNWNCVCTNGLTQGALAIWDEDPTGVSKTIVGLTIPNAAAVCAFGPNTDGTWQETSDYFYFGITGWAALTSSLITATGSDQGMLTNNPDLGKVGLFHMYGTGFVEKFNWGDCGPNKYTATANAMLLIGNRLNIPMYTLYQRDRLDAPEPFSMFWYNPQTQGDWWNSLPLDHEFNNVTTAWMSMRSSWTDPNAAYIAIKAGSPLDKQTHSNLDAGTFVLEALGQRWAGELCQGEYLNPGYFVSDAQNAQRWMYYRCATEGQNTILYNSLNQNVNMAPPIVSGSTNESQNSLSYTPPTTSSAYFTTDLTTAYNGTSIQRGYRMVNGRTQFLLRDEIINAAATSQWRMHTNATLAFSTDLKTATMTLNGQTLSAVIRQPAAGTFGTAQPVREASDPALPTGGVDLPNPGVTVLTIDIPAGTTTVEVIFNPSWNSTFVASTPPDVALAQWSTTSHN